MSNLTDLLPCPFCEELAGPIMLLDAEHGGKFRSGWAIECSDCTAAVSAHNSEAEAIAAWNRRASTPAASPTPIDAPSVGVTPQQYRVNVLNSLANWLRTRAELPRNTGEDGEGGLMKIYAADLETMARELTAPQVDAPRWQAIESAPKDGTRFLGWNEDYGIRETKMNLYGEGSPGYADWKAGKGPREAGWDWYEPKHNWGSSWKPTHWMPLPAAPVQVKGEA